MSWLRIEKSSWRVYVVLGAFTITILIAMVYILYSGNQIMVKHTPLIDAAMEIKLEATTAHLWFEEILSGDRHESMDDVWKYLESADWYAKAMLEGGKNQEGNFAPLEDSHMRDEITEVRQKLAEFKEITQKRLKARKTSASGTEIDQQYDAVFKEFVFLADDVETQIQQIVARKTGLFQKVQFILIGGVGFLSIFVGMIIMRYVAYLQQAKEESQLEKARAQKYLDIAGAMIVILDSSGKVNLVNKKGCQVLGYNEQNIVKKNWFDHFIPEKNREDIKTVFNQLMKGDIELVENYENSVLTKSGEERIIAWHNSILLDDNGKPVGTLSSGEDITERVRAQEALRNALTEVEQLKNRLQAENTYLQEEIKLDHNFEEIIGQSEVLKKSLRKVEQVAETGATVLILGETGTGKELLARAIHNISIRSKRPLVKVNCAALPANLIESELFGHEKGAFTGALSRKIGRFELADGGTIFLDEIGELPLDLQSKLLRVLQEGEFERLGSSHTQKVDVRIIAATNRDLEKAIEIGEFRRDLFYRLNVFPIHLPPLRERTGDISILAGHFITKFAATAGKKIDKVPQPVINALQAYHWPGNVRELENIIERAVILTPGDTLQLDEHLLLQSEITPQSDPAVTSLEEISTTIPDMEKNLIQKALEESNWIITGKRGAATRLGIPPSTLRDRMKKYGIKKPTI